jgi:hypothetical protein
VIRTRVTHTVPMRHRWIRCSNTAAGPGVIPPLSKHRWGAYLSPVERHPPYQDFGKRLSNPAEGSTSDAH